MARVIRGEGSHIVPGEVHDARAQAAGIVARAEQQAEQRLAEAEAQAQRSIAIAHEQAEQVREEARRKERQRARAEAIVELARATAARQRILDEAETDVLRLAMSAAQRVVHEELALDPQRIRGIVADVLARARRATHIRLRVHPDDLDALRALPSEHAAALELEADPDIARGGCVAHTDVGDLDARVEAQLEALQRALAEDE